jgi:hypothetical protein
MSVAADVTLEEKQTNDTSKKRKAAVYLGYLGAGYHVSVESCATTPLASRALHAADQLVLNRQGMQRQPGFKTIETDLEAAMVKAGAISEQNAGSFTKVILGVLSSSSR